MEVFIIGYARTPIGSFLGSLSSMRALSHANILPCQVDCVYFGNVLGTNLGQAPATQASILSGIPSSVPTTTINKVCASGMKAVMVGAQDIMLGHADIVVCGGMESMSNVPHYIPKSRTGARYGNQEMIDGIVKDGLFDPYNQCMMGNIAEMCAEEYKISRKEQDEYAIMTYERAIKAHNSNTFASEIFPVEVSSKGRNTIVKVDEEITNFNLERVHTAKPVFLENGTVTAPNSSTLSDGASALILVSRRKLEELKLKPLAKIISFADAAQQPEKFTTSPSLAIPLALKKASLTIDQIDLFEINEAFSVVALANMKILQISQEKCNIYGGGVSIGHPLGSSGSRIIGTLITALQNTKKNYGAAAVCNGGGGASAIIIQRC